MPKGVFVETVRGALDKKDKAKVLKVLNESSFLDSTKEYIHKVLIDGWVMQAAGDLAGVSRQLVHRRCKDVLKKAGINVRIV